MSLVSSLAFPGSKTLAGWWRQLAIHQPRAFGVGYLFVHRIEAPVWTDKTKRIEPLVQLLLQAVHRQTTNTGLQAGDSLAGIDAHLHLGRQILFQVLNSLTAEGLTTRDGHGRWNLTLKGSHALAHGDYPTETSERRTFHFVERLDAAEQRTLQPHFVNLRSDGGQGWTAADSCLFDVNFLRASIEQSVEWKRRFEFPAEVRRLVEDADDLSDETAEAHLWKNVIVDRLERFLTAWTLVAGQDEHFCLMLYPARQDGWSLNSTETLLRIAEWSELFPGLNAAPTLEQLKKAWLLWASSRGLPDTEAQACELSLAGHRLQVRAGQTIVERLKKAKSDVFKGDTWLLIGDGALRTAVLLQVE